MTALGFKIKTVYFVAMRLIETIETKIKYFPKLTESQIVKNDFLGFKCYAFDKITVQKLINNPSVMICLILHVAIVSTVELIIIHIFLSLCRCHYL